MPVLGIDLQDGFIGDTVAVRVGGREVFRGDDMRTSPLLGYAHTLKTDVAAGRVEIAVDVSSRGLSGRTSVDVSGDTFVAVSVSSDGVAFRTSDGPFGYA